MSEKNALTIYTQFDNIQKAAIALQQSGYFKDVTSQAQAIVKVMAGAELGLPPFASMTGINIIQGKPTLGANVLATLVKNSGRYDFQVKVCDANTCVTDWYENGKKVGTCEFTMAEAKAAGLTDKDNWRKYPSDMLFARNISRGTRRFASGVFGGSPVYTPDEMGVDTDEEGFVEGVVTEPAPVIEPSAAIDFEVAKEVTTMKGAKFGDLTKAQLKQYIETLEADIKNNHLTPEQREDKQYKRDCAIAVYMSK